MVLPLRELLRREPVGVAREHSFHVGRFKKLGGAEAGAGAGDCCIEGSRDKDLETLLEVLEEALMDGEFLCQFFESWIWLARRIIDARERVDLILPLFGQVEQLWIRVSKRSILLGTSTPCKRKQDGLSRQHKTLHVNSMPKFRAFFPMGRGFHQFLRYHRTHAHADNM